MPVTAAAQPAATTAALKLRESVSQLSDDALERFREALRGLMARTDNRGYQFYAGWHGVPLGLCQHHNAVFLPWHRGYLYHFELALQDIDRDVTLPWWDWVDEAGIPDAYDKRRTASRRANVLHDAPIKPFGVPPRRGWPTRTSRQPGGDPSAPPDQRPIGPPFRQYWDWITEPTSFDEFNRRLTLVHDNIHGWVGGQMGDPNWAAFDPLFWAHHTMVDRVWRIWQHRNPGAMANYPFLDRAMTYPKAPSFKVREVLKVAQLGYEYAAQSATVGGTV